jgi:hypothetical protein
MRRRKRSRAPWRPRLLRHASRASWHVQRLHLPAGNTTRPPPTSYHRHASVFDRSGFASHPSHTLESSANWRYSRFQHPHTHRCHISTTRRATHIPRTHPPADRMATIARTTASAPVMGARKAAVRPGEVRLGDGAVGAAPRTHPPPPIDAQRIALPACRARSGRPAPGAQRGCAGQVRASRQAMGAPHGRSAAATGQQSWSSTRG